ncbi:hypothetical protein AWJ20_4734 [Sugiyamaella lignohabitans]|uniref:PIPK domain-containing protein n=1 Tax=Sugiyamaella lignohabitans TaxID=796027 RepID=A0A161HKV8_9ASCO|nr:uncharacterized protein AWJ20_4734 [Sugiyamaella lignohabitans]ANB13787.1 hypothetical protein AWJ20_4734 [Sugiyamaella lignohabitans]
MSQQISQSVPFRYINAIILTPIRSIVNNLNPALQRLACYGLTVYIGLYYWAPELLESVVRSTVASDLFIRILLPLGLFAAEITCPTTAGVKSLRGGVGDNPGAYSGVASGAVSSGGAGDAGGAEHDDESKSSLNSAIYREYSANDNDFTGKKDENKKGHNDEDSVHAASSVVASRGINEGKESATSVGSIDYSGRNNQTSSSWVGKTIPEVDEEESFNINERDISERDIAEMSVNTSTSGFDVPGLPNPPAASGTTSAVSEPAKDKSPDADVPSDASPAGTVGAAAAAQSNDSVHSSNTTPESQTLPVEQSISLSSSQATKFSPSSDCPNSKDQKTTDDPTSRHHPLPSLISTSLISDDTKPQSPTQPPPSPPKFIFGNNPGDFTRTNVTEDDLSIMNNLSEGIEKSIESLYKVITPVDANHNDFTVQDYNFSQTWKIGAPKKLIWRDVKFKEYSPKVLKRIRQLNHIDDLAYSSSFEHILLTKTPAGYTYYSRDKQYIIKPFTNDEFRTLRASLPLYYQHLLAHPDSSAPRYCGLYKMGNTNFVASTNTRTSPPPASTLAQDARLPPVIWAHQGLQNQAEY